MRTTLALDDDVLEAARGLAARTGRTIGEIVSDLARTALARPSPARERNGIRLLPVRSPGTQTTLLHVNELRDEAP